MHERIAARSRARLSQEHPGQAVWMKYVDPEEREGEHSPIYEREIEDFKAMEL